MINKTLAHFKEKYGEEVFDDIFSTISEMSFNNQTFLEMDNSTKIFIEDNSSTGLNDFVADGYILFDEKRWTFSVENGETCGSQILSFDELTNQDDIAQCDETLNQEPKIIDVKLIPNGERLKSDPNKEIFRQITKADWFRELEAQIKKTLLSDNIDSATFEHCKKKVLHYNFVLDIKTK